MSKILRPCLQSGLTKSKLQAQLHKRLPERVGVEVGHICSNKLSLEDRPDRVRVGPARAAEPRPGKVAVIADADLYGRK